MKKSIIRNKKVILLAVLLLILVVGITVFLLWSNWLGANDTPTGAEAELEAHVTGSLVEKSIEDMIIESVLIVYGKVSGRSEAFQILPASTEINEPDGEPMNFTDVYFEPIQILRGETKETQLSVRIMGGIAGGINYFVDTQPELKDGTEYVLFLYQPQMGGGYNTEGDYYYVSGAMQGSFEKSGENFVSKSGESLTLNDLGFRLSAMRSTHPVDYDLYKNTFLENLNLNLESGFITQEEYDQFLAQSKIYATTVN